MNGLAIKTVELSKSYGDKQILKGINLAVPKGACYGFIGANGACLLYTSPSPRDKRQSRMPSSA